ncbi:diguanylate cyclase [Photobacterium sp.]|uniref:sensor domain-containing diguanylate cyclase n=1 Tax=Photobacterium sp. TaxID=660 RepID=UPI00299D139A|nr:diguanylate cyclase [Photobacterium sp.]MDX1301268.1 diguanylate cyclase [Photobacterium sp.]
MRWLIISPFFVLMLISGFVLYLFSTVTISNVANSIGTQYIQEVESRIYDRISDFTAPLSSIVEINRNAFSYQPTRLDDLTAVSGRLYEQAIPYPHMTFVSIATIDGRYIASSRDPIGEIRHNIAANYVNQAFMMEGFEYDPVNFIGDKILTDPSFSYDPRTRPFYTDAVKNRGMTWSPIHPYYGFPTLGIGLAGPIYSQQGDLLGVAAASIALIELDEYLEAIDLVENAYTFIAEEDGALIATSERDELYKIVDGVVTRITLATHANKLFNTANQYLDNGEHSFDVDGDLYLYRVHPITLPYGKKWLIGIIIPESHHKNLLAEYSHSLAAITLGIFVCIGLVGSLIAHYISKPIQQLNLAANDSKLESIQRLPRPISHIFEINSLAQELQKMANILSDIMQNLEQKVAQRTSYLQGENQDLLELSLKDELTGLYNRRGFNQIFSESLAYAEKNHKTVTFVMCDIDYFKHINDNYGHNVGDLTLIYVAETFKSHVRPHDIVARYGGEEFALVFVDIEITQVILRLNQIRQSLSENPAIENHHITLSFGVTEQKEVSPASFEELISSSDGKLYQAKHCGRNRIIS